VYAGTPANVEQAISAYSMTAQAAGAAPVERRDQCLRIAQALSIGHTCLIEESQSVEHTVALWFVKA